MITGPNDMRTHDEGHQKEWHGGERLHRIGEMVKEDMGRGFRIQKMKLDMMQRDGRQLYLGAKIWDERALHREADIFTFHPSAICQ